jgi:ATP-dependent protease HslVU (ClpYQ) peptidase subunit
MSVVVAYRNKTEAWMAFDSAIAGDDAIYETTTPKAIKHAGDGLIGAAGDWSVINAIESLKATKCTPYNLLGALKELKKDNDELETEILFAYPNKPLALIQVDFSVVELKSPFMAIGAGAAYALGYLEACKEIGKVELVAAVETAAKYSQSVMKPVKVLRVALKEENDGI